jgi:predicted phosphodiesterase
VTEPKTLLVAGDTHQNPHQIVYLFQEALNQNVDAIFQVGDFGYFEHFGGEFLDFVSEVAVANDIPFYWIDGNHENHPLLREKYADSEKTPEGFWTIRPGVYYVPRGTRWEWQGLKLMGFGGAASIDKNLRLKIEREGGKRQDGTRGPATGPLTQWWPEEQPTEDDLAVALQDPTPLDILFTHDKPTGANTPHKDIAFLRPPQEKVQTLVQKLKPKLLIHGHLHHRYTDRIMCGDDGRFTRIEGLDCDNTFERSWVRLALA